MPLDDRDRSIIAQVAVKEATNLVTALMPNVHPGEAAGVIADVSVILRGAIYDGIAVETVEAVFPGTTQQQDAQVIPHPTTVQPVQNAPQPPAPIPGVQADPSDALWQELVQHPENFYDNRHDKRNPKAPDFKHKTKKEGQYNVGLWLRDKPAWVTNY